MTSCKTWTLAAAIVAALCGPAAAESLFDLEPLIWKAIKVAPGTDPWQACRHRFRSDVATVRPGPPGTVWCYVTYHHIYGPGEVRTNFNN
jgi:hypothetical protein